MKVSMTEAEVIKAVEHYARCVYRLYPVNDTVSMSHYASSFCTFTVEDNCVPKPPDDEPTV